jgi:hypothetical protein
VRSETLAEFRQLIVQLTNIVFRATRIEYNAD